MARPLWLADMADKLPVITASGIHVSASAMSLMAQLWHHNGPVHGIRWSWVEGSFTGQLGWRKLCARSGITITSVPEALQMLKPSNIVAVNAASWIAREVEWASSEVEFFLLDLRAVAIAWVLHKKDDLQALSAMDIHNRWEEVGVEGGAADACHMNSCIWPE